MAFGTLILTVATALSGGCSTVAESNRSEAILTSASNAIAEAGERYDYSGYDMDYDELLSFTKQKYCQYGEDSGSLDEDEAAYLTGLIQSDDDYTYFKDLDAMFIKSTVSSGGIGDFGTIIGSKDLGHDLGQIKNDKIFINHDSGGVNADKGDGGGGSSGSSSSVQELCEFEQVECNHDNISVSENENYDNCLFFGIRLSKDACSSIYNTVASWLYHKEIYTASGINETPAGVIYHAIQMLALSLLTNSVTSLFINGVVREAVSLIATPLSSLWASFCKIFDAAGPVGFVVATILLVVGAACICLLCTAIIFGYLGKGFVFGWKVHSLFNREFVNEATDY